MLTALKEFIIAYGSHIVGYIFFVYIVIQLTRLAYNKGYDLWEGIKGDNGILDPEDFAILMWVIVFPVVVFADIFLDLKASSSVWWSMDAILGLILGYKGWGKNGKDQEKKEKKEDQDLIG